MTYEQAKALPPEQYEEWLEWEPEVLPPSAYNLGTSGGRCGFLEAFFWRGEAALFEAVNHAWNSLSEPRTIQCVFIGMYAGTGGGGKWALAKMLRHALREALDYEETPPWGQPFPDIHVYHAAAMDYFAASQAHLERTIQKYADILNGEPGRHAPDPSAQVIIGPWTAIPATRRQKIQPSLFEPDASFRLPDDLASAHSEVREP